MQTIIHYATPPGWRPRSPLPALRRVHAPTAPTGRGRGGDLQVRTGVRPRPAPEPRRNPSDWDGPQDSPATATFGLPWYSYLAAAVACSVLLLVSVWRHGAGAPTSTPAAIAVVGLAVSLWGLADYARVGAAAIREERDR